MKKNDIVAVLLIVAVAGVISYFIANALIKQPQNDPVKVEKVTPVGATFPTPDARVFNDKAIDPTVEISGDGQVSSQPFDN